MSEQQTPSEESQLEQLVLRLLTPPFDPRNRNPRLLLGKLPDNFPLAIPVPGEARVLGTLVRGAEHLEIVLESKLPPEEIVVFYRAQLSNQGWSEPEDGGPHRMGGFVLGGMPGPLRYLTFCHEKPLASIILNIGQSAMENAATDIRLHVNLGSEGNPCVQQKRMRRRMHHGYRDLIPPLAPPPGAQQRGGGGGGGDSEWHSNATLKTDLDLATLNNHYSAQLSKGGWTQSGSGTSDPVAWSTWKFTDEDQQPWSGLLFVLRKPEKPREYVLQVRAEWERADEDEGTGWYSSSPVGYLQGG